MKTSDLFELRNEHRTVSAEFDADLWSVILNIDLQFKDLKRDDDRRSALSAAMRKLYAGDKGNLDQIDAQFKQLSTDLENEIFELSNAFRSMVMTLVHTKVAALDELALKMANEIKPAE